MDPARLPPYCPRGSQPPAPRPCSPSLPDPHQGLVLSLPSLHTVGGVGALRSVGPASPPLWKPVTRDSAAQAGELGVARGKALASCRCGLGHTCLREVGLGSLSLWESGRLQMLENGAHL